MSTTFSQSPGQRPCPSGPFGTRHSTCTMRGSVRGGFIWCASCLCAVPGSRERPGWQHSAAGAAGGGSRVPEEPQPSWRWVPHNASTPVRAAAGGLCPGMPSGASTHAVHTCASDHISLNQSATLQVGICACLVGKPHKGHKAVGAAPGRLQQMWGSTLCHRLSKLSCSCKYTLLTCGTRKTCMVSLWAQCASQPWLGMTNISVLSIKAVKAAPACDWRSPLLCTQPMQAHFYLS